MLPEIFQKCSNAGIILKVYQHCLPHQTENLKNFYNNAKIEHETFNFSHNLIEYFSRVDLAITRSGASMLAELTNAKIPFISIPLPSSADNHQFENAFFIRKKFCIFSRRKRFKNRLFFLIEEIYKDRELIKKISSNQSQYSDKNVYNNIDKGFKKYNK